MYIHFSPHLVEKTALASILPQGVEKNETFNEEARSCFLMPQARCRAPKIYKAKAKAKGTNPKRIFF